LAKNLIINNIKNVKPFKFALTDRDGSLVLYGSGGSASIKEDFNNEEKHLVNTTTLDNICRKFKKIDLIKIDVEGAEDLVLKGGETILDRTREIILEVHNRYVMKENIVKFLIKKGFDIREMSSRIEETSILFCRKNKASIREKKQ